ncbi:MAG: DNA gyrase subunit A [Candidatus Thorarchaeota archaeon]
MDIHLPKLYKDYGDYSNYRNFPLDLDGLKPVERRVLLSAFTIAKQKLVKSRQVDAYTIGHYHPHGECYGTIVQMVRQGFLDGQGNFGTNIGVDPVGPAAPRYTECKISKKSMNLAFKYINHVPFVDTELGDKEPDFLPTMFPLCLLGVEYTQGIGFGYKTFIPCYQIKDLYQRLLWLLKIRKRKPIIAPITDCNITSPSKVLDELLTKGKARVEVEGVLEVFPRKNMVTLRSWPPGRRFQSLLTKFSKELSENMIGFTDLSSSSTEIVFQVIRERNRDKIFKDFLKKLQETVKGVISFEVIAVDSNRNVVKSSIDEMLLNTHESFKNVNESYLNYEISKLNEIINEYRALELIRKPLSACIKDGFSIEETIKIISDSTPVTKKIIEMLINKYRISKLLTLDTDTTKMENQEKDFKNNLEKLDEYVLSQYEEISKT